MPARDRSLPSSQAISYIQSRAVTFGLDPQAVLAVASREGLGGGVGDGGTSFGPWQLHAGGALPSSVWSRGPEYAQQWAWSPAGIDYALSSMVKAGAENLSGPSAIDRIVRYFERPANPNAEVAGAITAYHGGAYKGRGSRPSSSGGGGGGILSGVTSALGGIGGAIGSGAEAVFVTPWENVWNSTAGAASSIFDVAKAFLWLANPINWLRAVELMFGFVLMLVGLYYLGKTAGSSSSATAKIGTAATLVPGVGTAAKAVGTVGKASKARKATTTAKRAGGTKKATSSSSSSGELASAKVATERERAKAVRARRRRDLEATRSSRKERAAAERRAMFEGAAAATAPSAQPRKRKRA
jgi:hypothetical protein